MGAAKTEWKEEIEQIKGSNLGGDNSWELVGGEMVCVGVGEMVGGERQRNSLAVWVSVGVIPVGKKTC